MKSIQELLHLAVTGATDLERKLASSILAAAGEDVPAPQLAQVIHFPITTPKTTPIAVPPKAGETAVFTRATKKKAKLRFAFDGPAGSGKTYSSLVLAKHLGGRTALIDTEHGSASKYAHLFDFDTVELEEFSLDTYLKSIEAAAKAGYDVLVVDSLSHAWTGKGGALEEVDRTGGKDKFTSGWRQVTPKHTRLVDALLAYPGHVICTMRTKMEYVLEEVGGKKVPRKIGMAPVQREGMEYEFDVVADLAVNGDVTISKTRCSDISGSAGLLRHADVPAMAEKLRSWLSDGVAAAPAPAPQTPAPVEEERAPPAPAARPSLPAAARQPSPFEQAEIALKEASSKADIDKVVVRIQKLPKRERDALRPLWAKRVQEVNNAPA